MVAVVTLVVAALVGAMAWDHFGPPGLRERALMVQDTLRRLRASVDSCRMSLATGESEFRRFDERVDGLRKRVREYEALDPRGVPQDSFEVYMDVFERYNEAVPRWKAMADSLQARTERCRERTRAHNVLADSLRDLLVEIGEFEAGDLEPGPGGRP